MNGERKINSGISGEISERQGEWREMGDFVVSPGGEKINESDSAEFLREKVIDMTNCREGALAHDFPSGIYMYHGAHVLLIERIIKSGALMNNRGVYRNLAKAKRLELEVEGRNEEEIRRELKKISTMHSSGREGISWSVNGIEALPGDAGHIAGFVAAPESVLGEDKLVVPTLPAPYELLQVSNKMDAVDFFEIKKQYSVWGYGEYGFLERATVESGLLHLYLYMNDRQKKGGDCDYAKSFLLEFAERGGLSAERLREYYRIRDGWVMIDDVLRQQKLDENYLPPAAVFIQYMVDAGLLDDASVDRLDVGEIIKRSVGEKDLMLSIMQCAKVQGDKYSDEYQIELDKIDDVAVPIEGMYFVTSHRDLERWLEVMKEAGHMPRGVLLYDDKKITRKNFGDIRSNDYIELSREIGCAVGVDRGFWLNEMGVDVKGAPRAGTQGHVLDESVIDRSKEVCVIGGEVVISDTRH